MKERKVDHAVGTGGWTETVAPSLDYRFVRGSFYNNNLASTLQGSAYNSYKANKNAFSMMGETDVIRFTKANDDEKKKMLEEFN